MSLIRPYHCQFLNTGMAAQAPQRTFGRNVIHVYLVVCIALSCR